MPAHDHFHDVVRHALERGRELYLAIPIDVLETVLVDEIGTLMLQRRITRVIGFSPQTEEITRWIP